MALKNRWNICVSIVAVVVGSGIYWRWHVVPNRDVIQRGFWDVVYDKGSIFYDCVDWFTFDAAQRLRLRTLKYFPTTNADSFSVLEVGIGTGRLHVELATRVSSLLPADGISGTNLAGLDMAHGMVQLTKKRVNALHLVSDLRVGDVTKGLPWEDETFDLVVSTFVLSAISDGTAACGEMNRVLKPGGKIVIVDAGVAENENWMSVWLAKLWELLGDYMRNDVAMLSQIGLDNVSKEDYGPWGCVHATVGEKAHS